MMALHSLNPSLRLWTHTQDVSTLHADILNRVREKGETSTPWMNGSMLGSISLRDPIMRDGVKAREKAERVWDHADAIHSVCEPVVLEGSSSGLAKLLSLRLIFTAPFTNVLSLRVEANLKRLGITASIKVESMVKVCWWSISYDTGV
ncbi:hypothetical protein GBAR_LOCUS19958 [Geodia barretti]|uniref:Uncharacterized protein n=1 Tax=Geodia barretti TaxID=519541 RepID=A0AA35SVP6_GEOBA|nr:hypothetical protein GBAR_LOCUS19958 [Geodia barretti]